MLAPKFCDIIRGFGVYKTVQLWCIDNIIEVMYCYASHVNSLQSLLKCSQRGGLLKRKGKETVLTRNQQKFPFVLGIS